jgi:hypothetical protein
MQRIVEIADKKRRIDEEIANAPRLRNFGGSPKMCVIGNIIYSYNTAVAVMDFDTYNAYVPVYHSTTTTRHINKIASEYNMTVVKMY